MLDYSKFYDINQLPKDWGVILFPISMSKTMNSQSPKECMNFLEFSLKKITENKIGAHFVYSDWLYMNLENESAEFAKKSFLQKELSHVHGIKSILKKEKIKFQITEAFSFNSWFQMNLNHNDFSSNLSQIKRIYEEDEKFQYYMKLDAEDYGKELNDGQINFFLEEHLFNYLQINQKIRIQNDFVKDREKWILFTYPGRPPLSQIYLYQLDPFNINKDNTNPFKGQYDILEKKFIDYEKVVLPEIK